MESNMEPECDKGHGHCLNSTQQGARGIFFFFNFFSFLTIACREFVRFSAPASIEDRVCNRHDIEL